MSNRRCCPSCSHDEGPLMVPLKEGGNGAFKTHGIGVVPYAAF